MYVDINIEKNLDCRMWMIMMMADGSGPVGNDKEFFHMMHIYTDYHLHQIIYNILFRSCSGLLTDLFKNEECKSFVNLFPLHRSFLLCLPFLPLFTGFFWFILQSTLRALLCNGIIL